MTQQTLSFPQPTTAGDLKPLDRIRHGEDTATITGYRFPRSFSEALSIGGRCRVQCRADSGEEFELAEDAVVEVAS